VNNLSGKIWQKFIAKSDVKDAEQKYRVISSKLIGGRPLIHIYADENPGNGFEPVAADLEDVFFTSISRLQ
jgi:ABC-2 type transport system ATP-binding protein